MKNDWFERFYGLETISFKEEINLPKNKQSTRRCKMEIVDMCNDAIGLLNQIINRAKRIPVEDNDVHAELVRHLRDRVKAADVAVVEACFYNGEDVL